MDLLLPSDVVANVRNGRGAGHRLYHGLREAILDGRVGPGERLPSTREFAASLALSRNTVTEVYERLAREGYLEGKHGSDTYVAVHDAMPLRAPMRERAASAHVSAWAKRLPRSRSVVPPQMPYSSPVCNAYARQMARTGQCPQIAFAAVSRNRR